MRNRNLQKQYHLSRSRQNWNELHDGTTEEQAADFIFNDVVQDSATIDFTYTTSPRSLSAKVIDDSITDAKLRNSTALSIIGRASNSTGDPADIAAATDGDILYRNGAALVFGNPPAASVVYDPSATLHLTATEVQSAIDELSLAENIEFDNGGGIEALSVTNSSFETGDLTGWTTYTGSPFTDTNHPHTGSWDLVTASASGDGVYQDLSVTSTAIPSIDAGTATLDTTYWHRSNGSSDTAQMLVEYYDSGMSLLGSTSDTLEAALPTRTYKERGLSGESIPANTRIIRVKIYGENSWSWLDDVSAQINWSSSLVATSVQDAIDELDITIGSLSSSDISDFDEGVDDRVNTLIQDGTGISWSYNDPSNTLTPTVTLSPFSSTDLSEGTNLYYTDERAQDAVGAMIADTDTIDLTYTDATPEFKADLKDDSVTNVKLKAQVFAAMMTRVSLGI